jgi:hypothetical protein
VVATSTDTVGRTATAPDDALTVMLGGIDTFSFIKSVNSGCWTVYAGSSSRFSAFRTMVVTWPSAPGIDTGFLDIIDCFSHFVPGSIMVAMSRVAGGYALIKCSTDSIYSVTRGIQNSNLHVRFHSLEISRCKTNALMTRRRGYTIRCLFSTRPHYYIDHSCCTARD